MKHATKVIILSTALLLLVLWWTHRRIPRSLIAARQDFKTKLIENLRNGSPFELPEKDTFEFVHYDSNVGPLGAYLTPDPQDNQKHPAIIWIRGGDCNSIGDVWSPAPASNDQSAAAYRQDGIVMMFPSLRGGNQNPGIEEKFLGEVDDVVAAADFLAQQRYVDPNRMYLGGHSTGGTLVLLVSECTDRFRSVFSFGPVAVVTAYSHGTVDLPFDTNDKLEVAVRSPGLWLADIKSPTFVFEGSEQPSNAASLLYMSQRKSSPQVHFQLVNGRTHFTILSPANHLIAEKILQDNGPVANVHFTDDDIAAISRP